MKRKEIKGNILKGLKTSICYRRNSVKIGFVGAGFNCSLPRKLDNLQSLSLHIASQLMNYHWPPFLKIIFPR